MHSVTLDSSGSPKKRTISRGLSEDESLRSIIKETETPSRRLARSDSRAGTLKKRSDSQQSEQDLFMGLPEMLELQASYDEVVQELRGLEVEREALLFQVDVLQDTLEGVEELLAEAQREAGQASLELEQEKEAKRKLESMVSSLMQEVERLKEENKNKAPVTVNGHGGEDEDEVTRRQVKSDAQEVTKATHSEPHSRGKAEGEDQGNTPTKLLKMVCKTLNHLPSLALDNPVSEDGVLRRPYENGVEDGRDPSPDRNDSDSISTYEDASADTPEQDKMFPGEADLPDDSDSKDKSPINGCQGNDDETRDPKNESCVMS